MKKLAFGLMRLPLLDKSDDKTIDFEQLKLMVDTFIEEGFTYFDTAYFYHNGVSEIYAKKALASRYPRDKYLLADKLPVYSLKRVGDQERIFKEQLDKCGVEYFDFYLLHALNKDHFETAKKFKSYEFLKGLKKEGKIKHLCFSFHDTPEVLEEILKEFPEMEYVQLQINYIDWESKDVQARRCYEIARKYNKKILIMEPVKGGYLVNIPPKARELLINYNPSLSIPSYAIRYAASLEGVEMVLSGMSNIEQLKDNISYMKDFIPLNQKEKELIEEVVKIMNETKLIGCTNCRYCMEECPQKIEIPRLFEIYNEYKKYGAIEKSKERYLSHIKIHPSVDACLKCGFCEYICPQKLPIRDLLEEIKKGFI